MTKNILKRKPTIKRKFMDGKTFIHPTLGYRLADKRREMIDYVNHWVRLGLRFKEIAPLIKKSPSTVANYYYGFANHCLSTSQIDELKLIPGSTVTVRFSSSIERILSMRRMSTMIPPFLGIAPP